MLQEELKCIEITGNFAIGGGLLKVASSALPYAVLMKLVPKYRYAKYSDSYTVYFVQDVFKINKQPLECTNKMVCKWKIASYLSADNCKRSTTPYVSCWIEGLDFSFLYTCFPSSNICGFTPDWDLSLSLWSCLGCAPTSDEIASLPASVDKKSSTLHRWSLMWFQAGIEWAPLLQTAAFFILTWGLQLCQ